MAASGRTGPSSPEPWLHLAVRYLARRDRTIAQVEQFLRSKGASPAQARQTVGRLSDLRYLNDRAYAGRWVESRLARRAVKARQRRGRRLTPAQMQRLLRQWGFEEETIDRMMGALMKREESGA